MLIFRQAVKRLLNILLKHTFNSDYIIDLNCIDGIYRNFENRIATQSSSRYLWRSVCQCMCQSTARNSTVVLVSNIVAVLLLPATLVLLRVSPKSRMKDATTKYLKIDFHPAYQIPMAIRDHTMEVNGLAKYLTLADFVYAIKLFATNRAFYPELLFKFMLWIAKVRPYLDRYEIRYLIQYCEYSSYSSLRKHFLNHAGIGLANVSHGEEFISCRSAFSSFDQYFAWDVTPKFIHEAMRVEYAERFTFNPCSDYGMAPKVFGKPVFGFLWPALEDVDLDYLTTKLNCISGFCTVLIRPHPNIANSNQFSKFRPLLNANISDSTSENIHTFIDRCSIIGGCLSAVLLQAAFRNRSVIYLNNSHLKSLKDYHEYYKKVEFVDLDRLDAFLHSWLDVQYETSRIGGST